ncbi:MAG: ABC transporter permease [Chloroflexi bacterium]|nr:ABC transporter permease [Chloroflexota bacterium]
MILRQIWAVYKRELGLYFRSPIAYAVAFALLLLFGLIFSSNVSQLNNRAPADNLNFIPSLLTFLMFLVGPLMTMRLLAEENREGTIELLMTLPMSETAFIVGKFFAVWTYYSVVLGLTLVYYLVLTTIGVPDHGRALGVYLGAWLYGGTVLAVTMIWSAITEDQIVAAFLGAATVLVLYLADLAAQFVNNLSFTENPEFITGLANGIRELGLTAHYNSTMFVGVIRAEDIAYFIFMIIAALFITTRIVETRRWRA